MQNDISKTPSPHFRQQNTFSEKGISPNQNLKTQENTIQNNQEQNINLNKYSEQSPKPQSFYQAAEQKSIIPPHQSEINNKFQNQNKSFNHSQNPQQLNENNFHEHAQNNSEHSSSEEENLLKPIDRNKKDLDEILPNPNNIIQKGKYELQVDKHIKLKLVDQKSPQKNQIQKKKNTNQQDLLMWKYSRQNMINTFSYFTSKTQDHECFADNSSEKLRCKQCQKTLQWQYYSGYKLLEPFHIFFNDYSHIESQQEEQILQKMYYFTDKIENLHLMREFSYTIMGRPFGTGFSQIYREMNQGIPLYLSICKPFYQNLQEDDHPNIFKKFEFIGDYENANLAQVFWVGNNTFHIILKSDTNSSGFTQWFNFGVKYNGKKDSEIKFVILNNRKCQQSFQDEMKITIGQAFNNNQWVWTKGGKDIQYYENNFARQKNVDKLLKKRNLQKLQEINSLQLNQQGQEEQNNNNNNNNDNVIQSKTPTKTSGNEHIQYQQQQQPSSLQQQYLENIQQQFQHQQKLIETNMSNKNYYSLEFKYQFKPNQDKIILAYSVPYTFTDLINLIEDVEATICKSDESSDFDLNMKEKIVVIKTSQIYYKKEIIGSTRLGLPIFKIEITSPFSKKSQPILNQDQKKNIFIIARQHPGETPGSFVCQGILKFLIQTNCQIAQKLREYFTFHIIPMMNPDGVVVGNNRCNISGYDMNRRWDNPDQVLDQEVYQLEEYLQKQLKKQIYFFLDLHGHSSQRGCFLFGNESVTNYNCFNWVSERLFLKIMNKITDPYFEIGQCNFDMSQQTTARYVVWKKFQAQFSFTLETSFYAYNKVNSNGVQQSQDLKIKDFEKIGESLLKSVLLFTIIREIMRNEANDNGGELIYQKVKELTNCSEQFNSNINSLIQQHQQIVLENNNTNINYNNINNFDSFQNIKQLINQKINQNPSVKDHQQQQPQNDGKIINLKKNSGVINHNDNNNYQNNNNNYNNNTQINNNNIQNPSNNIQNNNTFNHMQNTNNNNIQNPNNINNNYNIDNKFQQNISLVDYNKFKELKLNKGKRSQRSLTLTKKFKISNDNAIAFSQTILQQKNEVFQFFQDQVKQLGWCYFFTQQEIDSSFKLLKRCVRPSFKQSSNDNNASDSEPDEDVIESKPSEVQEKPKKKNNDKLNQAQTSTNSSSNLNPNKLANSKSSHILNKEKQFIPQYKNNLYQKQIQNRDQMRMQKLMIQNKQIKVQESNSPQYKRSNDPQYIDSASAIMIKGLSQIYPNSFSDFQKMLINNNSAQYDYFKKQFQLQQQYIKHQTQLDKESLGLNNNNNNFHQQSGIQQQQQYQIKKQPRIHQQPLNNDIVQNHQQQRGRCQSSQETKRGHKIDGSVNQNSKIYYTLFQKQQQNHQKKQQEQLNTEIDPSNYYYQQELQQYQQQQQQIQINNQNLHNQNQTNFHFYNNYPSNLPLESNKNNNQSNIIINNNNNNNFSENSFNQSINKNEFAAIINTLNNNNNSDHLLQKFQQSQDIDLKANFLEQIQNQFVYKQNQITQNNKKHFKQNSINHPDTLIKISQEILKIPYQQTQNQRNYNNQQEIFNNAIINPIIINNNINYIINSNNNQNNVQARPQSSVKMRNNSTFQQIQQNTEQFKTLGSLAARNQTNYNIQMRLNTYNF